MIATVNNRILSIIHKLEFDQFLTEDRKSKLEAELSKLLKQRDAYEQSNRKVDPETR